MPDTTSAARLVARARTWVEATFLGTVISRFFELEILDRSLVLAAQAFVALLPLEIVIVSAVFTDGPDAITQAVGNRFGLDQAARSAIRMLFAPEGAVTTVSWLAVILATVSALSLSRRLARVYGIIFDVTPSGSRQVWRGLVWICIQLALLIGASWLRDLRHSGGAGMFVLGTASLMVVWSVADFVALRLLVPAAPVRLTAASALLGTVGRLGIGIWAGLYMPHALTEHAAQYGPIGVTFLMFTYLLVAALVYLCAPLIATTWVRWRARGGAASVA